MKFSSKKRQWIYAIIVFLGLYSGCSEEGPAVSLLRTAIVETDDFYEITALGASASEKDKNEAQAKREAAEVARFQAYELLVEVLQGVGISGNLKLRDLHIGEGELVQLIRARLEGVRQAGNIVYERQSDGSWLAACTIQYDKSRTKNLSASLAANEYIRDAATEFSENERDYTGIVIDLRYEYDFTALSVPVIVSPDEKILFSIRQMDSSVLKKYGGVPVYSTIGEAVADKNGVGNFPLKIIPSGYDHESGRIILSDRDVQRILAVKNRDELYRRGKIVLIL